jgi:cytoskeletal protein CcmA (bactofilin family)
MFGKKKSAANLVIESVLDSKTTIHGNVSFASGIQILGRVQGDVKGIDPSSVLVIGQDAIIEGSVEAANVYIDGTVIGPVKASIKVVVHPHGKITGDVHYGKIQMEEGSVVRGQLLPMPSTTHAAEPAPEHLQPMPANLEPQGA